MQLRRYRWHICIGVLLLLLLVRYLRTLFLSDSPIGYDVGIYRYLFLKHGDAFPPFVLGDVEPWARGHPLGLFFFSTFLLKIGVPVDWLIGWVWNLVPVALILLLAFVVPSAKTFSCVSKRWLSASILLAGLLSVALYDGFYAMYWKTFAALFWMVLTFWLLDRKSLLAGLTAFLCLATHNQTGLLLALVLGTVWLLAGVRNRDRQWMIVTGVGALAVIAAALVYVPIWDQAIGEHLKTLLTKAGSSAPAGSFPESIFYLRLSGILLLLGAFGFVSSLKTDRKLTHWHLAVIWAAVFVVLRLFFYRRFFLHLDFFLLPFAALGILQLFQIYQKPLLRAALVLLIMTQGYLSSKTALSRSSPINTRTFSLVRTMAERIPKGSNVLVLDNQFPNWFLGWMPDHTVGGPGLFSFPRWSYGHWEEFLLGAHEDRVRLLSNLNDKNIYLIATPLFYNFYQEKAQKFLTDACFEPVDPPAIYRTICP